MDVYERVARLGAAVEELGRQLSATITEPVSALGAAAIEYGREIERLLLSPMAILTTPKKLTERDRARLVQQYSRGWAVPVLEGDFRLVPIKPARLFPPPPQPGKVCSYCGRRRSKGDSCPGCGAAV